MFKAVIFDRDGVIIDSEGNNRKTAQQVSYDLAGIVLTEADKQYIIARHPADYLASLRQKYLALTTVSDEDFFQGTTSMYKSLIPTITFIQPAVDAVKRLHESGLRLALNTSSPLEETLFIFPQHGLLDHFEAFTTFSDGCPRKPDPASYLLTAQKLGLSPSECVAIEDSSFGLQSAKAAGMACIIIPTVYTEYQDFSSADAIVESAEEVTIPFLESLRGSVMKK